MAKETLHDKPEQYRSLLLIGPPGSGKGTQGRILGQIPGFSLVSMGDVLRSLNPGEDRGRQVHRHLQAGELVPSELVVSVWLDHMSNRVAAGLDPRQEVVVLDGLPRNIEQAKQLGPRVTVERIIHLACEDESMLIERIRQRKQKGHRQDDTNDDVIEHRFDIYRSDTLPLDPTSSLIAARRAALPWSESGR